MGGVRTYPQKLHRFEVEDFASCGLVRLPLGRELPRAYSLYLTLRATEPTQQMGLLQQPA